VQRGDEEQGAVLTRNLWLNEFRERSLPANSLRAYEGEDEATWLAL